MKKINCPICNSNQFQLLYKIDNYQLFKCRYCLLVFLYPKPSSNEIKQFYTKDYFQNQGRSSYAYEDYNKHKEVWQKTFFQRLHRIKRILNPADNVQVLDIGCATGVFLELVQNRGWSGEGIEISKWAGDYGRKQLGLNIHHGTVESIKLSKKFDLVIMWDVVEHVEDLDSFLRSAEKFLKKDGKLVLSTPNIYSLASQMAKQEWQHLAIPIHLYIFSPSTIKKLLEKYNFKVIRIETEQNFAGFYEAVVFFLKRLFLRTRAVGYDTPTNSSKTSEFVKSKIVKWLKSLFSFLLFIFYIPIMLILSMARKGEIMVVYAVKEGDKI